MSSDDLTRRQWVRGLAIAAGSLSLGGCLTPLYGPGAGRTGRTTQDMMANVDVNPIGGRLGIIMRNELIYLLSSGAGRPANPTHTLSVAIGGDSIPLLLDSGTGIATAQNISLNCHFTLYRKPDNTVAFFGRAFSTASLDRNLQRLASDRAILDAMERAGKAVSEQIATQLATHFAAQR
jgi:LPS-assembly lipoprotein